METSYINDELSKMIGNQFKVGLDLGCGKDMTGGLLTPYGEYVRMFAKNHGISIDEAHQHPMCQARLEYFNKTGK